MKVLMITGIEDTAAEDRLRELFAEAGIGLSVIRVGNEVRGCIGCGKCYRRRQCMINDPVNDAIREAETADGLFVLCEAVYSDVDENIHRFMKRLFNCASDVFSSKPAACAVLSAAKKNACEKLNRYFEQGNMPVITTYTSGCFKDADDGSLQTTAENFIWLLRCIAHAEGDGAVEKPRPAVRTFRFIR